MTLVGILFEIRQPKAFLSKARGTHRVYRQLRMRVKCLRHLTLQYRLQPRRVRQTENAEAGDKSVTISGYQAAINTYFGVEFGAQTTANDSGNMR